MILIESITLKPTEAELQAIANQMCQQFFNYSFDGAIQWSKRLYKTAGRCDVIFQNGQIQQARILLSHAYFQNYGIEELYNILKHELAHYHLFRSTGFKHRHNSTAFRNLLTHLDAPRYAKSMENLKSKQNSPKQFLFEASDVRKTPFVYACPTCGHRYPRKKRIKGSCSICDKKFNPKHLLVLV